MKKVFALGVLGAVSNCSLSFEDAYADDHFDAQIFGNLANLGVPTSIIVSNNANQEPQVQNYNQI